MQSVIGAFAAVGALNVDGLCYYLQENNSLLYYDGCLAFNHDQYKYVLDCQRMLYFRLAQNDVEEDFVSLIMDGAVASLLFKNTERISYTEGYRLACKLFPEVFCHISLLPVPLY